MSLLLAKFLVVAFSDVKKLHVTQLFSDVLNVARHKILSQYNFFFFFLKNNNNNIILNY
jgi:hypothetical protein